MKTRKLEFAAFKGVSLLSNMIRMHTRGDYSHIGIVDGDRLIEQWPHGASIWDSWMDYSDWDNHTKGTPYEIWSLELPVTDYEYCMNYYQVEAERKTPYDFRGILGFITKGNDNPDKTFCSEAAIIPLVKIMGWDRTDPATVDPSRFVSILQAAGGALELEGAV